ncbi:MAG: LysE family transporter [Coriobacteriia bacterium]|nr:LysE family transporter [Coriobacteriia bacterium]
MLIGLFVRTFVIGAAIAAPIGAMGMLCIQRTLERGTKAGVATGLGIATADGLYAALAAFGVTAVSSALVSWRMPLQVVGGCVLVWFGLRSMLRPAEKPGSGEAVADSNGGIGSAALYGSAVGLTLANPMTIMSFVAVFASAVLPAGNGTTSAAVATAGVALGSLAWWVALIIGVSLVRVRVGSRTVAGISRVSGAVLVLFGVVAVWGVHVG